jgi:hypothetical protein
MVHLQEKNIKKILAIGDEITDFFTEICRGINNRGNVKVDIYQLRNSEYHTFNFNNDIVIQPFELNLNKYSLVSLVLATLRFKFIRSLIEQKNWKTALRIALLHKKVSAVFSKYDYINFHYLTQSNLFFLNFVRPDQKVILSFWGSDLYYCNQNFPYDRIFSAVKKADAVTLSTPEMREIFLSKYGRDNPPVIFLPMLAIANKIVRIIEQKNGTSLTIKNKIGVSENKIILTIGHSAHPVDNHIEILKAIKQLEEKVLEKISLILPLTYGSVEYIQSIKKYALEVPVETIFLEKFLTEDEIAELRLSSPLIIRMSEIDGFSQALCESLFAESIAICGSWLPYGKLRSKGVYYIELDDFKNLPDILSRIINNFDFYKNQTKGNREKMKKLLSLDARLDEWENVYLNV